MYRGVLFKVVQTRLVRVETLDYSPIKLGVVIGKVAFNLDQSILDRSKLEILVRLLWKQSTSGWTGKLIKMKAIKLSIFKQHASGVSSAHKSHYIPPK